MMDKEGRETRLGLTGDEVIAEQDCCWCKLSEYDDDGNFVKCNSEKNPSGRPLLECPFQMPDYGR